MLQLDRLGILALPSLSKCKYHRFHFFNLYLPYRMLIYSHQSFFSKSIFYAQPTVISQSSSGFCGEWLLRFAKPICTVYTLCKSCSIHIWKRFCNSCILHQAYYMFFHLYSFWRSEKYTILLMNITRCV